MPKVSVVITTYNRRKFAEEAVKSVLSQTFRDFELILVDDGSTDDTQQLARYNLKYIFKEHSGISAARNAGAAIAKGKYICFLDDDDLWKREKLEKQISFMEKNPEYPICYSDEIWIRNGKFLNQKKIHQKEGGNIFKKCLEMCIISPSSAMIRSSSFRKYLFDEKLPVCEDYDLWLRIAVNHKIGYIPEKLIIKRGGHSQLSKKFPAMDRFRIYSIQKILRKNIPWEKARLAIEELERKSKIVYKGAVKRGRLFRAVKYWAINQMAKAEEKKR